MEINSKKQKYLYNTELVTAEVPELVTIFRSPAQ